MESPYTNTFYDIYNPMSNYDYLKLKLKNVSEKNLFSIHIIHYTDSQEFDFEFENSTYWIERGLLNFYDNETEINEVESMLINPIKRVKTTHKISINHPYIYNVQGEIIDKGDKVLLKIKAISYLLEKNKKYLLKFRSKKATNELEILF
ncbi:hypothetical protein [uncultured Dokdonia sp.]|uniref:hypothetical protein n=1 Tax=uncultured Dokdonia sp. TaxID=575653 RepID=UPI00260FA1F6|nr:hypothetical protein [uncultured Dokdonia sp.]